MPLRRLDVELVASSGRRLTVLADRYRADVHQQGWGDGYSGFSIALHRLSSDGPIHVTCPDPASRLGTIDLSRPQKPAAPPLIFAEGDYILAVDRNMGQRIDGWATLKSCPTSRRLLLLRCGGQTVLQQRATLFREAATEVAADGYHGFSFPLPTLSHEELVIEDIESGHSFIICPGRCA